MADSTPLQHTQEQSTVDIKTEDFDPTLDPDIDMEVTEQGNPLELGGAGAPDPAAPGLLPGAPAADPKIPSKKDTTLREFFGKMDEYAPIVSALAPKHPFICNELC